MFKRLFQFFLITIISIVIFGFGIPRMAYAEMMDASSIQRVYTGTWCSYILMKDGTVKSCGFNASGELGWGNRSYSPNPTFTTIPGLSNVKQLAVGNSCCFALLNDGTVKAWGFNESGNLGTSSNEYYLLRPETVSGLSEVKQIFSGINVIYVILNDGTVKAWGSGYGKTFVNVPELTGIKQIVSDLYNKIALMIDGTVKVWGYNAYGQLGTGNYTSLDTPTTVPNLTGVSQVALGNMCSYFLMNDGTVKVCGQDDGYQLGIANCGTLNTPTTIPGVSKVKYISSSDYGNTFVILNDGTVKAWGNKLAGCGNSSATPVTIPSLTNIIQLSSFSNQALFIMGDGSITVSGMNTYGELGTGDTIYSAPKKLDFVIDNPPQINVTIPTCVYENMQVSLTGTIKDIDNGDTEKIYYRIDRTTGQTGVQLGNTITANGSSQPFSGSIDVSGLIEGKHTIYVWVQDDSGFKSSEATASFLIDKTIPNVNKPILSVNSSSQINVKSNATDPISSTVSSGVNSYLYNRNGTDVGSWTSNALLTDSGLTPNTQYTYKYKVSDKVGNTSDYSQIASVYTLANQPADLKVTGGDGDSIKLSWSANNNPNGTEYCIAAFDSTGKVIKQNTWTTQLTDTITGLNALDSYIIKVKARNVDKVETDWFEVETSQTVIDTIKSDPHGTYITFSWAGLPGATGYDVEVDGQVLSIGNKTSHTMKDLKLGTQHTFRVRGKNFAKTGQWSPLQSAMTTAVLPGKPLNLTYTVTNTTATINWDAATDAESYEVSEIITGQDEEITDNGNVTTCELRGLAPASSHTYKIRAVNSIGAGEWSDPITITTFLLDTPSDIVTIESDTSIFLGWSAVKDATSYVISINGTETTTTTNVFTFSKLTPETKYTFRVKAVGANGESSYSDVITTATTPIKPAVPKNVHVVVSDITITIRWDKVESAEGYDVELDGIVMENDNVSIYIHDGLESDTMHTYRVRARNSAIEGDWSDMQYIKTLPGKPVVPKNIEIRSTTTGANLTWQGKDSDLSYDIKIYDGTKKEDGAPTDPVIIENIAKSTYTHRRTALGQEYTYWIRTRNKEGVSDWSGKIINNAIKAKCTKNKTVDLGLTAKDVTDFSAYTMVVTYNASAVDVIDLSTLTGQFETVPGRIEGTDIEITDFTPGKITFKCDKVVNLGEAWTGVINSIKFRARATGGTTITYTVFCKQEE